MRQIVIPFTIATMTTLSMATAQQIDLAKVKQIEHQLEDVMELTDTLFLKHKLTEVEASYHLNPDELNEARLGIIYHEISLNLSFLYKTEYKGYAKRSYDILSRIFNSPSTTNELMPFIASYRASALSLLSAETNKLKILNEAFLLFEAAVEKYAAVSYLPQFLRGSVAENLPWFFFSKRKSAKLDFQFIIDKQEMNANYANQKIMSFTYLAWAKQHQSDKNKKQVIAYVDKSIELDPNYQAGRKKAEELKSRLVK